MTTTLTDVTLPTSAYVLIGENLASALLQIKGPNPARIVIAQRPPAASVVDGIVMGYGGLSEIALNDLDTFDKIYGIAIRGETKIGGFTVGGPLVAT